MTPKIKVNNRELTVSESTRRVNPHLFSVGGFQPAITQQKTGPTLVKERQASKGGSRGPRGSNLQFRVSLTAFVQRLHDSDNIIGGFKPLRDAIAKRIGIDDADKFIEWEYGQTVTRGLTGTVVRIELL